MYLELARRKGNWKPSAELTKKLNVTRNDINPIYKKIASQTFRDYDIVKLKALQDKITDDPHLSTGGLSKQSIVLNSFQGTTKEIAANADDETANVSIQSTGGGKGGSETRMYTKTVDKYSLYGNWRDIVTLADSLSKEEVPAPADIKDFYKLIEKYIKNYKEIFEELEAATKYEKSSRERIVNAKGVHYDAEGKRVRNTMETFGQPGRYNRDLDSFYFREDEDPVNENAIREDLLKYIGYNEFDVNLNALSYYKSEGRLYSLFYAMSNIAKYSGERGKINVNQLYTDLNFAYKRFWSYVHNYADSVSTNPKVIAKVMLVANSVYDEFLKHLDRVVPEYWDKVLEEDEIKEEKKKAVGAKISQGKKTAFISKAEQDEFKKKFMMAIDPINGGNLPSAEYMRIGMSEWIDTVFYYESKGYIRPILKSSYIDAKVNILPEGNKVETNKLTRQGKSFDSEDSEYKINKIMSILPSNALLLYDGEWYEVGSQALIDGPYTGSGSGISLDGVIPNENEYFVLNLTSGTAEIKFLGGMYERTVFYPEDEKKLQEKSDNNPYVQQEKMYVQKLLAVYDYFKSMGMILPPSAVAKSKIYEILEDSPMDFSMDRRRGRNRRRRMQFSLEQSGSDEQFVSDVKYVYDVTEKIADDDKSDLDYVYDKYIVNGEPVETMSDVDYLAMLFDLLSLFGIEYRLGGNNVTEDTDVPF